MSRMLWVGVPFYLALLAIILLTLTKAFNPLYRAAREVREAGRTAVSSPDLHINEEGLPSEILPFVKAINYSFRRLGK